MFIELCCVEAVVRMGHVERTGVAERDGISQVGSGGEHLSGTTELLRDFQHLHGATDLAREGSRRAAQPPEVEHPHLRRHTGQAGKL
jgi:hypothetical protein